MKKEIKQSPFTSVKRQQSEETNNYRIAVIVSDWNKKITEKLLSACHDVLKKAKVSVISISHVPGCFELPYAAKHQTFCDNYHAIICLGCVIKGDTIHDQVISFSTAATLQQISIENNIPVIFGVITVNTEQQALDRAGGSEGNKGEEAALTALEMIKYEEMYPVNDMWNDDEMD